MFPVNGDTSKSTNEKLSLIKVFANTGAFLCTQDQLRQMLSLFLSGSPFHFIINSSSVALTCINIFYLAFNGITSGCNGIAVEMTQSFNKREEQVRSRETGQFTCLINALVSVGAKQC